ncbi:hypothetical protein ACFQ0M_41640 [Kitasatospora aburaviensis]
MSLTNTPSGLFLAMAWEDGLLRAVPVDRNGPAVDVRLGTPVRTVLATAPGDVVCVLAEGLARISLPAPVSFGATEGTDGEHL